jgi:hypothetical protein
MKKLSVFLISLALSSTSFADRNGRGGGDDWVTVYSWWSYWSSYCKQHEAAKSNC